MRVALLNIVSAKLISFTFASERASPSARMCGWSSIRSVRDATTEVSL
eukprot:COSAG06_NODE_5125_length_3701_cov_4.767629_2_plen_48_part_00